MTSQFLEVPRGRHGGRLPPLMQTAKVEQEIHSRCIGVHELSSLMQRRFPMGGYNINVSQGVYKIQSPSFVREVEVIKKGGVYLF